MFYVVLVFLAANLAGNANHNTVPLRSLHLLQQEEKSSSPVATLQKSNEPRDASATESNLVLKEATPVRLKFLRTVSSSLVIAGESADLVVVEDICVGNVVVISRGSIAQAIVTLAQAKRAGGLGGNLGLKIETVHLASGESAPLRMVQDVKGKENRAVSAPAPALQYIPYAGLFLIVRGKDAVVPKGTEVIAYVNQDIIIDPVKFPASAAAPQSLRDQAVQKELGGPN